MSRIVLDSSVLLALIRDEPVQPGTVGLLQGACISAVNYAEVWTKIHEQQLSKGPRTLSLLSLLDPVEPFSELQAKLAAQLRSTTQHAGLSLADRACLALALDLGAEVYTADRAWAKVNVGCRIHLIR